MAADGIVNKERKRMKTLIEWIEKDKFSSVLICLALIFTSMDGLGGIIGLAVTGSVICFRILHWHKTLLALIAIMLIASPAKAAPEPQSVGGAIGVVVVVVGGVVTYKVIRYCQKFWNRTNVMDKIERADSASIYSGPGSCLAGDDAPENIIQLDFRDGKLTVSALEPGPLDRRGLKLGTHYWNGVDEIEPEASTIRFSAGASYMEPIEQSHIVERSRDLEYWEPVLEISQPAMPWILEDSFEETRMFYRVR